MLTPPQRAIAHVPLPIGIAYRLLPIAYRQLPIACCLLPIVPPEAEVHWMVRRVLGALGDGAWTSTQPLHSA